MAPRTPGVSTHGLTHLALGVHDIERAFAFYQSVFGMVAVYRGPEFLQAQTPGARDIMVFERAKKSVGKSGGIAHFGFRLKKPDAIDLGRGAHPSRGRHGRRAGRVRARRAVPVRA